MKIPTYTFRLRDAADRSQPKIFVDMLVSTGKFYRNERSQILFEVKPGDYVVVDRKQALREIIADGTVIRVDGDLGDSCTDCLWFWLTARKHTLTRIGGAWNPPAPLPVRHVAPADRYSRGRDCA